MRDRAQELQERHDAMRAARRSESEEAPLAEYARKMTMLSDLLSEERMAQEAAQASRANAHLPQAVEAFVFLKGQRHATVDLGCALARTLTLA